MILKYFLTYLVLMPMAVLFFSLFARSLEDDGWLVTFKRVFLGLHALAAIFGVAYLVFYGGLFLLIKIWG